MEWWIWQLLGLLCIAIEVTLLGGFVFLFFGVSALLVGALVGFTYLLEFWQQSLAFLLFASVLVLVFRSRVRHFLKGRALGTPTLAPDLVGERVLLHETLAVGGESRVDFRGSLWSIRNVGAQPLLAGGRYPIARVEYLTLCLVEEGRVS